MPLITTHHTYNEFIEFTKTTPRAAGNKTSSEGGGYSFTKTHSLKEAYYLAENGWDAGISELAIEEGVLASTGVEFNPNVHGSTVNVPNYIQGLPDSMWEMTERREYNLTELEIFINLCYVGGKSADDALKYASNVINYVNEKQKTHNVKLTGYFASRQLNDVTWFNSIVIKDFDQRFVINNIAFAFHPSFFRRIWFRALETTDFIDNFGYGSPKSYDYCIEQITNMKLKHKVEILPSFQHFGHNLDTNKITTLNP